MLGVTMRLILWNGLNSIQCKLKKCSVHTNVPWDILSLVIPNAQWEKLISNAHEDVINPDWTHSLPNIRFNSKAVTGFSSSKKKFRKKINAKNILSPEMNEADTVEKKCFCSTSIQWRYEYLISSHGMSSSSRQNSEREKKNEILNSSNDNKFRSNSSTYHKTQIKWIISIFI